MILLFNSLQLQHYTTGLLQNFLRINYFKKLFKINYLKVNCKQTVINLVVWVRGKKRTKGTTD